MAADGSLIFDTGLDNSGFINGLNGIQSMAVVAAGNIAAGIVQSVSSAMAAIPQQMVSIGAGFESSMSQVAATMGITDTAEEFGILTEAAKELGESTKYSAQQAGESLNYLALAGMNAEEAVSALPTVLNVAAAGGMELAAASDLITDAMSALDHEYAMGIIADDTELYARRKELLEQYGDESNSEHWSYYEKLHDMEQDFSDEQLRKEQEYNDKILAETAKADKERAQEIAAAMDEQQDIVDNGLKDTLKKYQDAYDEIEKKRQAYRNKLMSVGGDLFTVETDDNGNTSYIVNNIDEQLRKMREYDSAIRSLKEQNASDALIAELTSMSDEDSYQFAEYLSGMSASEFGRINELYNEKQKLADELSKDMYADEAQAVSDAMTEELAGLVTDSYDYGAMSAEQFALGFSEALNELKLGTVYNQLNAAGASRSYENYVIKDESGKERTIKLDIDISGKSNVYLDNQKVGEQVTDYQKKTAHIKGE